MLTNNVVNFEQLEPDIQIFNLNVSKYIESKINLNSSKYIIAFTFQYTQSLNLNVSNYIIAVTSPFQIFKHFFYIYYSFKCFKLKCCFHFSVKSGIQFRNFKIYYCIYFYIQSRLMSVETEIKLFMLSSVLYLLLNIARDLIYTLNMYQRLTSVESDEIFMLSIMLLILHLFLNTARDSIKMLKYQYCNIAFTSY